MRTVILATLLALTANAQEPAPLGIKDWKFIKEMSGPIPHTTGLTVETYAAEIARGDNRVRLILRFDMPGGAPAELLRGTMPFGFDISSVTRVVAKAQFDCGTLSMKVDKGTSEVYQFNGKKHKSKEAPFKIESTHIFARYFCEQPSAPSTGPPVLKKKP